jgi:hypothetical protein
MCIQHNLKEELKHEIKKISQILIKQKIFIFKAHFTYKNKVSLLAHQIRLPFLKYT